MFAHLRQSKGSDERSEAALVSKLKTAGYRRSIVRSDGEKAIESDVRDAVVQIISDTALEFLTKTVSEGQLPGNGLAERTVRK